MGQTQLLTGSSVSCGGDGSSDLRPGEGGAGQAGDVWSTTVWRGEERRWTGRVVSSLPQLQHHLVISRSAHLSPPDLHKWLLWLCGCGRYPGRERPDHSHRLGNCRLGMSKLYDRMSCQYRPPPAQGRVTALTGHFSGEAGRCVARHCW